MAGLSIAGLEIKRLDDVRRDLRDRLSSSLGVPVDLDRARSVFGILVGAIAPSIAAAWSAIQQVYDASSPDTATGAALDNLAALVGVYREPAVAAEVELVLSGTVGATVPSGKLARSSVSGRTFELLATVTIGAGGTSTGRFRAEEPGAVFEPTGAISEIVTPTAGWSSVTNPADLSGGRDAESDSALRLRRQRSLGIIGAGTDQAIAARVEALAAVAEARVISNRTSSVDGDGRPPKSFELLVWPASGVPPLSGPEEREIAALVWELQPAGIESTGSVAFEVEDVQGFEQVIRWSYVEPVEIYAALVVVSGPGYAGDTALASELVERANESLSIGSDVWPVDLLSQIAGLPGVLGATLAVGTAPAPTERLRLLIPANRIARFATFRVVVTSSPA